jgi:hypothetical protein
MKSLFTFSAMAICFAVAPNSCFALWDVVTLTKEEAKQLGMEVRATATRTKSVHVVLEFKTDGKLKDFSQIDMRLGKGDDLVASATLREDRSKPGRVAVGVVVGQAQLDKLTLSVRVPYRDGGLGGVVYELPVKDFVEMKRAPNGPTTK